MTPEEKAREIRHELFLLISLAATTGNERNLKEACDIAEERIAAALREAAPQWRTDMENAPRDREILLAGQWLSGRWEVRTDRWLATRWPFVGQNQPSRWMDLPAPPAEGEGR